MRQRENTSVTPTLERMRRPWSGTSLFAQLREASVDSGPVLVVTGLDRRSATLGFWLDRLRLTRLRAALLALVEQPKAEALALLYRLSTERFIGSVDQKAGDHESDALLEDVRMQAVGRFLAAEAPRVAAVALGIALLSRSTVPADRSLLLELGTSEHLAGCVAELLSAHGTNAVFALAQRARGKARCCAIEWLADADDPKICGWLLREGALDAEHHHHIAYLCASTGRLSEALSASQVDAALLSGAARLLHLLATSVSAPDIGDYDEASAAIAGFVTHTQGRALSAESMSALEALAECPYVKPSQAAACRERLDQAASRAP